ncbi:MAG: NgoPII family restriction endonuclease [Alphaproteobacteria bacterium]|nr:MAG: NgoPII family restriction endonuclease [Alphaproteobacteria bacterium]TAF14627.1 MAG: NgoPII family restriction endonuclease [Alphaproteobacteria bacterium]TAF41714.1 MAG: NgoPII family restriction endonuclease [Alphaproteobacteria bacterium]TAF75655.1 MAG: NgoPII family restriction endonuclease [Alphaproteobacteria bacterium]
MAIVSRMTNTLRAILHMLNHHRNHLSDMMPSANRMNDMGRSCEQFIKDIFSELPSDSDEQTKLLRYAEVFSYSGNQNHPPDLILKNGDAIEIKKIESRSPNLALNSSYPKHKLYATNKRILASCKNCESTPWDVKDIVYVIAHAKDKKINSLWMIYGDCYAASPETYERIHNLISENVYASEDIDFIETNELAKIQKIDPLGITDLRVRGMWSIAHPSKVFAYLEIPHQQEFSIYALMCKEKYLCFTPEDRTTLEQHPHAQVRHVLIKNPDNPVQLLDAVLIVAL